MKLSSLLLAASGVCLAAPAYAVDIDLNRKLTGPYAALEGHASLFSDAASASLTAGSFGYGARGGYRWSGWGLYGVVEHNMWMSPNTVGDRVVAGAVNFGVGGEYSYVGGFLFTSLSVGPSVLAFDTVLDEAGTTGMFFHLRPVGFRFPLGDRYLLSFTPLSFATVAPVLDGIPLVYVQYRTSVGVEGAF